MGQRTAVNLPFAQGLQQQESAEWLDPGSGAAAVVNGLWAKHNALDKRLGMGRVSLASSLLTSQGSPYVGTMSLGVAALSWSRCALAAAGLSAQAGVAALYSATDDGGAMVAHGPLPAVSALRRGLPTSDAATTPTLVDVPYAGGVRRFVFYGDTQADVTMMAVINADTGTMVAAPVQVYGSSPTSILATYLPNAPMANQVCVVLWFAGSPGSFVGLSVAGDGSASATKLTGPIAQCVDLAPFVGDPAGGFVLFYQTSGGDWYWQYRDPTWFVFATGSLESGTGNCGSGCYVVANYDSLGEQVAFLYEYRLGGVPSVRYAALAGDGTFASAVAPKTIAAPAEFVQLAGLARLGPSEFLASWTTPVFPAWIPGGVGTTQGTLGVVTSTGAYSAQGVIPLGFLPVSTPFSPSGGLPAYQWCCTQLASQVTPPGSGSESSEQCTLYLLCVAPAAGGGWVTYPVATFAPRQVDPFFDYPTAGTFAALPAPSALTGTRFAVGLRTIGEDSPAVGSSLGASWSCEARTDAASVRKLYQSIEVGGALHLAAAVPMIADGVSVVEDSYFLYPEFAHAALAAAGVTVPVGTFTFAVCYRRVDATGQLLRSAPAFTGQVTTTGGGKPVEVTFPPYPVTFGDLAYPGTSVMAEVYRTVDGGSTFYLEAELGAEAGGAQLGYTSVVTDAHLQTWSILYTNGGILDGVNPPSLSCLCAHVGRVWGVDDTRRTIWFTTAQTPGDAPRWNEALTIPYSSQGEITGLYSLDDKLLVGTAQGLAVVYGQGPGETNQGSDLTVPQPIACDAGPTDWRSGCVFPGGLLFASARGIMLCDRSLNVSWIGKDVVDSLAAYPEVLSATLVPTANHVRFVCRAASGATVALCYDYLASRWLTHTYPSQPAGVASAVWSPGTPARGASYCTLTADGTLWAEHVATDPAPWLDDDGAGAPHFVTTSCTTGWVKLQGVEGYQQAQWCQLLFEGLDPCGLTVGYAINYDPTIRYSHTWPESVLDDLPRDLVQLHVAARDAKQMSLQVTVSDVAGPHTSTGRGARFVDLALSLVQLSDQYRHIPVGGRA